jgi:entericidin B
LVVTMVLAGCNTMNGVGKDMEKAGEAVQKKASE